MRCGKKGTAKFVLIMSVADKNGYVEAKAAEPLKEISKEYIYSFSDGKAS